MIALVVMSPIARAQQRKSEVEKLMRDRPQIAAIIEKHRSLRAWLEKSFNGNLSKSKIFWRDDDSSLPANSHGENFDEQCGTVIVVSRKPSAIDQLTILIYECVNAGYKDTYRRLIEAASAGKIEREDFVLESMQTEHKACLGAQRVLRNNLHLTKEEASKTDAYRKVLGEPSDFARSVDYYQKNKRNDFDARVYYRSLYDQLSRKSPKQGP